MTAPVVVLVGADKGGVGKTFLSRVLLDYLAFNALPVRGFDTEGPLHRFYPTTTEVVDLTTAQDQMKVFDALNSRVATVIDIRAGLLSPTLRVLRDIGFLDQARAGGTVVIVLHVLGSNLDSLTEIEGTADIVKGLSYFAVKNHVNAATFFEWDQKTNELFRDKIAGAITIPQLNERAVEALEVAATPFSMFVDNKSAKGEPAEFSMVLRGYTAHWLKAVYSEFDRVKLADKVRAP